MSSRLESRLTQLETELAVGQRTHVFFAHTKEEADSQIAELIRQGKASEDDKFIHVRWQGSYKMAGGDEPQIDCGDSDELTRDRCTRSSLGGEAVAIQDSQRVHYRQRKQE